LVQVQEGEQKPPVNSTGGFFIFVCDNYISKHSVYCFVIQSTFNMAEKQPFEQDLAEIRSLMEKSSKFISLSGLSGILAGVYALLGGAAAYFLVQFPLPPTDYRQESVQGTPIIIQLSTIAVIVLAASLITGLTLSARKAKQLGLEMWNDTTWRLIANLAVPLVTGGVFIILLLIQGRYGLVAPVCLIFYGLALVNASSHLFDEVRYLGYSEIILGLVATALPGFGLMFWTIGFGIFHVFYGALMFRKYDQ
jgi:hypothetical protein